MKVIFHIDENEKWKMTLGNVKNMLNYASNEDIKFKIEILANGAAVTEFKSENKSNENYKILKELSDQNVDIAVCKNALSAFEISENEIYPFIRTVPAGVVELTIKQDEGYAYIKP